MCMLTHMPEQISQILGKIHDIHTPRQGWTSEVVLLKTANGHFALKRSSGEKYVAWLEQEHRMLKALGNLELPIPQAYTFTRVDSGEAPEAWLLMDALPGDSVRVLYGAGSEADRTCRLESLFLFGRTLAALHAAPVPAGLPSAGESWLDRMLEKAHFNMAKYKTEGTPELLEWLRQNRPTPVPQTLIHGDFTVDNTLMQNSRVTAIIDWAGGACGDPRYDIALATRPKTGLFDTAADREAFYAGYGREALSDEEFRYFDSLYDFF